MPARTPFTRLHDPLARLACVALVLAGFVGITAPALAGETDDEGWSWMYNKDGIEGWRRSTNDSKFHEWRGEGLIEANFYRVVAVYMDSNRSDEWVADCVTSIEVEKPDIDHQVTYNRTHLPRPFSDRDFIWGEEYIYDMEKGTCYDTMKSIDHPDYPEVEGVVRGTLLSSSFYAKYIDEETTFVEVRILVDPGGRLPAWLVNAITRSWPYVTFRDLREQVYTADGYDDLEQQIRDAHPMEFEPIEPEAPAGQ